MGGSGGGGSTTVQQDVPPSFKPAFTSLFNSAFGAARTAAGQDLGQRQNMYYPQGPFANAMTGGMPVYNQPQQGGWGFLGGPEQMGIGSFEANQFQQHRNQQMQQQMAQNPGGIFDAVVAGPRQGGPGGRRGGPRGGGGFGTGQTGQQAPPTDGKDVGAYAAQSAANTPTSTGKPSGAFGQNLGTGFNQMPSGFTTPGSTDIPLASGEPIIGQAFPGRFTAPTSPLELEALMGREAVGRQMGGLGNNLLNLGQAQAGGAFLSPASNPFFTQNIEASLQPAIDAFSRSVMPQFSSQAIQGGAFKGSSARDMAAGNLANDFGRNLAQTAAQQGMQNYLQERMIQQQTPQMLDAAARLQQLSPEILSQAGLGQRELWQRGLDEALLQFQEMQQAPFRPLGPLANIIQGTNVGLNTTQTVPTPSALAQGISGALGGAGMGAGLADVMGWSGGKGGASLGIGSLLGALGGALR